MPEPVSVGTRTSVYLDPRAAAIDPTAAAAAATPDADALDALALLIETGAELRLLVDPTTAVAPALRALATGATPAIDPRDGPAWLIVANVSQAAQLPAGVRSILVGPSSPGPRAVTRCDLEAPTIRAAVLEILVDEAMPAGR